MKIDIFSKIADFANFHELCPRIFQEKNVPTLQQTTHFARSAQESSGEEKETPRKSTAALKIKKIQF